MSQSTKVSLNGYVAQRDNVVLFFAGVGAPGGAYTVLGCPDADFAERRGLLDLIGTVGEDGGWRWDGEGEPRDDRGNTIYHLHAYEDVRRWASLTEE